MCRNRAGQLSVLMCDHTQQKNRFLWCQADHFSAHRVGSSASCASVTDSFKVGCSAAVQAFPADFCLGDTLLSRAATLS